MGEHLQDVLPVLQAAASVLGIIVSAITIQRFVAKMIRWVRGRGERQNQPRDGRAVSEPPVTRTDHEEISRTEEQPRPMNPERGGGASTTVAET